MQATGVGPDSTIGGWPPWQACSDCEPSMPRIGPPALYHGSNPFLHRALHGHRSQFAPQTSETYQTSDLKITNKTSEH